MITSSMKIKEKVVKDGFTWLPMDKRVARFGYKLPPRKPELRTPLLWARRKDKELFLVNLSGEKLDKVTAKSGGFQTVDDDIVTVVSEKVYRYKNVDTGEAVKIDEHDEYYDLDYVFQVGIKVQSKKLGSIEILTPLAKGGISDAILLWDNGDVGKNVCIKKLAK